MDVKPWEPAKGGWTGWEKFTWARRDWKYVADEEAVKTWLDPSSEEPRLLVTLANGQCIIVRALSEDRKAARAAMKEAKR